MTRWVLKFHKVETVNLVDLLRLYFRSAKIQGHPSLTVRTHVCIALPQTMSEVYQRRCLEEFSNLNKPFMLSEILIQVG